MKKYAKIFLIGLQETIQYRTKVLINILVGFIPVFIQIFLWLAIYASVEFKDIDGLSFRDMVSYLILALIVNNYLSSGSADRMIGDDIKEGTLSRYLLKPINNFWYYLSSKLGGSLFYLFCIFTPVFIIIVTLFYSYKTFFVITLSLIALFQAYLLYFIFNYIIGLITFWMTNISSLFYIKDMFLGFIAGKVLPLNFFPEGFIKISNYLPFQYMVYFPINAFLNTDPQVILNGLFVQIIWIVILGIVAVILWKFGIRKYSAVGN